MAAAEASHEVPEDDRLDWDEVQSDGAESSQDEGEVPPLENSKVGSSLHVPADVVVQLENKEDDDAPFQVRRRNLTH
jgi:hypothetical protein